MKSIHAVLVALLVSFPSAAAPPALINQKCAACHNSKQASGGLDLSALPFNLSDRSNRDRWIRIHDRIEKGEMPPKGVDLPRSNPPRAGGGVQAPFAGDYGEGRGSRPDRRAGLDPQR